MAPTLRQLAGTVGLALLVLAGCKNEEHPNPGNPSGPDAGPPGMPPMPGPPGGGPPIPESGPHAAGKKVYNASGCTRCHSIGLAGPPLPKDAPPFKDGPGALPHKGPDLAKAAEKSGRDAQWFIDYVNDPRTQNPDSRMPPFAKKISGEDMRALAEFLASLK